MELLIILLIVLTLITASYIITTDIKGKANMIKLGVLTIALMTELLTLSYMFETYN